MDLGEMLTSWPAILAYAAVIAYWLGRNHERDRQRAK